jgi:putative ABC transport system permease protein
VRDAIEFPLQDPLRRVLFGLAAALLILAGTLLLSTLLVVAAEHSYAIAVMRALGASVGSVAGIVIAGAALLILPAALIGATVGVFGSSQLLGALGAQIGGVGVVISPSLLVGLLLIALLPAVAGFLVPPLLALRRAPLGGLHAER